MLDAAVNISIKTAVQLLQQFIAKQELYRAENIRMNVVVGKTDPID